ncbi:MAG: hypothetical protein WA139_02025 [Candidatus Aenigmatarchaeota archaeon]
MVLQFFGGIMAAIGALMILSHTIGLPPGLLPPAEEGIALKRMFYGLLLVAAGLLLIFYSPV